jgi:hypothetical protein
VPVVEHVVRVAAVGDDGAAADVAKSSASTPSTSARRCVYSVYRAGLWEQHVGSKLRTAAANQEPWRLSSSTRALTTAPDSRGEGERLRLNLYLLMLDSELPLLGGEAEELVRSGVHANAVDVADLALGDHGEQHRKDMVGADQQHGRGCVERPLAAGKHRRARRILDGEAGDDVAEEHI